MQTGNAAVALRIEFGSALKVEVEADVQHDSDGGGRRGGQTDHSQARIGLDAHEVGHGQAYQQGLHQTLHHDPDSLVVAVEITHHAEQHSSGDGLWREAFQIGESVCDHGLSGCQNYRAFGVAMARRFIKFPAEGQTLSHLCTHPRCPEPACRQ